MRLFRYFRAASLVTLVSATTLILSFGQPLPPNVLLVASLMGAMGVLLGVVPITGPDEEEAVLAAKLIAFALLLLAVSALMVGPVPGIVPFAVVAAAIALLGSALADREVTALKRDILWLQED